MVYPLQLGFMAFAMLVILYFRIYTTQCLIAQNSTRPCTYVRYRCIKYEALFFFDEVQCGLGRTGYFWAHEAYVVAPDIMTLAKVLANGLSIGVVLVKKKVTAVISYGDHGTTFGGRPPVYQATLIVLDKIQKPGFLAVVSRKGENSFSAQS